MRLLLISLIFSLIGCSTQHKSKTNYPENYYKTNSKIYRGSQPNLKEIIFLQKDGINSILNLRSLHSDKNEIRDVKINEFRIKMKAGKIQVDDIISGLKIMTTKSNLPIYVHCWHGSDRTGAMIASYRIVIEGWTKEKAIKEMINDQFGFHSMFSDKIIPILESLDVNLIRKELHIPN